MYFENLDAETQNVSRRAVDNVTTFLNTFSDGKTWAQYGPGENREFLENLKYDFVMLGMMVEERLRELYGTGPLDVA